ncbi:TATA-box binding [Seinonella peptonophila]|uniref:TATA-box binding n=1 Tax=Seinonella peptonophila TaxID=112248 RepID=A0A1M4XST3_9BACL|nr:YwmB family TATA-box binding protein [Seinonella peptonophila]SHE96549.1 TATA-box binding [Seinonella peptonophila]
MKSSQLIKLSLLFLFSLCLMGTANGPGLEQAMKTVFQQLRITPSFYVVHHGGRTESLWRRSEIDQLARYLAHELHLAEPMRSSHAQNIEFSSSGFWRPLGMIDLKVSNLEPGRTWTRPYLSIRITGKGERWEESFFTSRKVIERILTELKIQPQIDLSVQGTKKNVVNGQQYVAEAQRLLHAREVEGIQTDSFLSQSGYTPFSTRSLKTRGGWMNVQIASRIAPDQKRLIFTIGSPIITIEY